MSQFSSLPVYGADQAPKYFFTAFAEVDHCGGNCISFECVLPKGDHAEVQFVAIIPAECVVALARIAMEAVAEGHNMSRLVPQGH